MKYTTAKVVLNIYKNEGRFNKIKERNKQCKLNGKREHPEVGSTGGHNSTNSPINNEDEKITEESLLNPSFWARKITKYFRHKEGKLEFGLLN